MRLTNETKYPVAWLIMEEEEEEDYGWGDDDDDEVTWNECDNYIVRSTVRQIASLITMTFWASLFKLFDMRASLVLTLSIHPSIRSIMLLKSLRPKYKRPVKYVSY